MITQDVLFGKGTIINTHPGNQQFRSLVDAQKNQFMKAKNKVKRSIAAQVLSDIESLQPPGRFLVEVRSHNGTRRRRGSVASSRPSSPNVHPSLLKKTWLVVEREKALDKVRLFIQEPHLVVLARRKNSTSQTATLAALFRQYLSGFCMKPKTNLAAAYWLLCVDDRAIRIWPTQFPCNSYVLENAHKIGNFRPFDLPAKMTWWGSWMNSLRFGTVFL